MPLTVNDNCDGADAKDDVFVDDVVAIVFVVDEGTSIVVVVDGATVAVMFDADDDCIEYILTSVSSVMLQKK